MRTFQLSVATLLVSGCISYWDIREGESLEAGCPGRLTYYTDLDNDLWGEPSSSGTPLCTPDPDSFLTASNARDCDENDPNITGRVGVFCPDEIGGGSPTVAGRQQGNSEFVVAYADSPSLQVAQAQQDCEFWAGWDTQSDGGTGLNRGLASLETEPEFNQIEGWLTDLVGSQPAALWVDLRWEGTLLTGVWQWPDGSEPTYIASCGGRDVRPADFFPDLVPGQEEADRTLEEQLGLLRLALVYDGAAWCRGVPPDPRLAQPLCERPRPVLADFAVAPSGDGPPGAGE